MSLHCGTADPVVFDFFSYRPALDQGSDHVFGKVPSIFLILETLCFAFKNKNMVLLSAKILITATHSQATQLGICIQSTVM